MTREEQRRYTEEWQKKNLKRFVIKLNKTKDADILERLSECGNVQGYVKRLIREDMQK